MTMKKSKMKTIEEVFDGKALTKRVYLSNGLPHNEDGPAVILFRDDGSVLAEYYHVNGDLHRTDGPAILMYNTLGKSVCCWYYINGLECFHDLKEAGCVDADGLILDQVSFDYFMGLV